MYFIFGYLDVDAPIELRYCTLLIEDGASAAVEVTFDEGDFQYTVSKDWQYRPNRGKLGAANGASVTQGDDQPMSLSFQGRYSRYASVSDMKPNEILNNVGGGFTSTDSQACATYSCNLTLTYDPPCGDGEVLLFPDFRIDESQFGIRDGQVSFTGRCNASEPTKVS